jgi:hypothetical protein
MSQPYLNPIPTFPEEMAQEIAKWARKLGDARTLLLIDATRRMLGDPVKVLNAAKAWGTQEGAYGALYHSLDSVRDRQPDLKANWSGRAYSAYREYVINLEKGVERNAAFALSMSSKLLEIYQSGIIETYTSILHFISECHATIIECVGGVFGKFKQLFEMLEPVADALATFRRQVDALIRKALTVLATFRSAAIKIGQEHVSLTKAPGFPETSELTGEWRRR